MGISIRAYARHRGVSEAAVRKAIKTGRASREADGSVNPVKANGRLLAKGLRGNRPGVFPGLHRRRSSTLDWLKSKPARSRWTGKRADLS